MAEDTTIEWADDTANFWEGCTQISPACDFCYAMKRAERYGTVDWNGPPRHVKAGPGTLRRSNRRALAEGRRRLVFINSLSDVMDKNADPAWRRELFDACKDAPHTIPLILTKRIGNAVEMSKDAGGWPPNAVLGATFCNQEEMDRDGHKLVSAAALLGARAAFASLEPLLGPITFPRLMLASVRSVIVGGESGTEARPMHPDWVRAIRDQCAAEGAAFHFKQWGEWAPHDAQRLPPIRQEPGWPTLYRTGKRFSGRSLDRRTHDDFLPEIRREIAA